MTSTSASEEATHAPVGLITKETEHPLGVILLGEVVGAHWLNDGLILYYADKHSTKITIDDDDELRIEEHEVPTC